MSVDKYLKAPAGRISLYYQSAVPKDLQRVLRCPVSHTEKGRQQAEITLEGAEGQFIRILNRCGELLEFIEERAR
ncbi:MAG: hypothetical protein RQ736_10540 [Thiogranum sp.]|nr:hypothetical protein [Thiogranum sp.]